MKIRSTFCLLGAALLIGLLVACATSAPVVPIGNATGTATASSVEGFGGPSRPVVVTVTMENGIITDVVASGPGETGSLGGVALMRVSRSIIRFNSTDVDAISQATLTSDAVKEAAQAAIDMIVAASADN